MVGVKGIPLPAGIDNVVEQLGGRLVERGHEVTVYVRPHYTPKDCKEFRGMRLIHVPSIRTKSLDAITSTLFATIGSIRERPDVVHIHSTGLSVFAPFPRMVGITTIVQSHGLDWQRAKWQGFARSFLKMADYTTVHFPDVATVVSKKLKTYYEEKYRRLVEYIPNGAPATTKISPDEVREFGLSGDDYILFAARLVPEKWCHGLIEAYNRIPHPSKKLVIAGDGHYGDAYATQLKCNASENVRFLGFVTGRKMQALLSNAYIYVLPSEIEGLSTGLIEAMAYGNCALVSDIEENLEVIEDKGFHFKVGDVEDLRRKIEYLLKHPDVVESYRPLARDHVGKSYNWDRVTDQYETLYIKLIEQKTK